MVRAASGIDTRCMESFGEEGRVSWWKRDAETLQVGKHGMGLDFKKKEHIIGWKLVAFDFTGGFERGKPEAESWCL